MFLISFKLQETSFQLNRKKRKKKHSGIIYIWFLINQDNRNKTLTTPRIKTVQLTECHIIHCKILPVNNKIQIDK